VIIENESKKKKLNFFLINSIKEKKKRPEIYKNDEFELGFQ
jgi:hypothetical protein